MCYACPRAYRWQEILGGMLEVPPGTWLHPPPDEPADQQKRVAKFAEQWRPYDWTADLEGADFA